MGKFITNIIILFINLAVLAIIGVSYLVYTTIQDLPDYKQLSNYEPPIVTRFYAADGKLLEEYAKEHRFFVPINAIPKQLQEAFIAAEDKNFYDHPGIDFSGISRALIQNLINLSQNKKNLVGGSTITQQVVKNFLLTNEKTFDRKIKEAVLSFRITNVYSKDKILELYLNQIYLGSGSYGVASAALTYFNKSINELDIEESALLAALPKAPNNFSPRNSYDRALHRRNWVIDRMYEENYISWDAAQAAKKKPINLQKKSSSKAVKADFFAEAVRRRVAEKYTPKSLYEDGLYVKTTLDPKMQVMAEKAFRKGLMEYDRRRGYRGVFDHLNSLENWQESLKKYPLNGSVGDLEHAVILAVQVDNLDIGTISGKHSIFQAELKWSLNSKKTIKDRFKIGDVILVEKLDDKYHLRQIPKANGGLVVMDPHLGRVLAMVGGFDFNSSKYNRVDQAMRQPGSSFKPFVYLAALEKGLTPSTLIEDGPIEISQGPGMPVWRPKNYHENYLGPTTMRRGLELSRNTMTVNLSQMLGINSIVEITQRFGINKNPPSMYSMVLGSMETTLLNMTTAYASIVNGGKKVTASLIEKIQNRKGETIFVHDSRECQRCSLTADEYYSTLTNNYSYLPDILENREALTDERSAYQLTSILEGVIQHTINSKIVRDIGKTLAGKTGTTNDNKDTWFIGFSSDLVVGTYIGYDEPASLGKSETGATVAEPIFAEFMKNALKDSADVPFRIPQGIKLVKVNYETGKPSMAKNGTIYEAFKVGSEPKFVDIDSFSSENSNSNDSANDFLKKQYLAKKKLETKNSEKKFDMKEIY